MELDEEVDRAKGGLTRRELFQVGNVLAMPVLLGGVKVHAEAAVETGPLTHQRSISRLGRRWRLRQFSEPARSHKGFRWIPM